jgi:hypothetical protein
MRRATPRRGAPGSSWIVSTPRQPFGPSRQASGCPDLPRGGAGLYRIPAPRGKDCAAMANDPARRKPERREDEIRLLQAHRQICRSMRSMRWRCYGCWPDLEPDPRDRVQTVRNNREPLALMFPRSLDWALLSHTISVTLTSGQSIEGRVAVDQDERRWSFTPTLPWTPGSYQIRVAPNLEDVCGNTITAPFDRPLRSGSDLAYEATNRSIPFHLV